MLWARGGHLVTEVTVTIALQRTKCFYNFDMTTVMHSYEDYYLMTNDE